MPVLYFILKYCTQKPLQISTDFETALLEVLRLSARFLIYADAKKKTAGANSKTSQFAQSLRQAKILILEILYVFLRLEFLPSPAQSPGSST